MKNLIFGIFILSQSLSFTHASYNHEHSDKVIKKITIKRNYSLPTINLDNDPALKEYYHKNEMKISTSRSNVVETGDNGEELFGFLAFIREDNSIHHEEVKKKKKKKGINKIFSKKRKK